MRRGSALPWLACQAMRRVNTRVLPEPAPAMMHIGDARVVTASLCSTVKPASSGCSTAATTRPYEATDRFAVACDSRWAYDRLSVPRG